VLPYDRAAVRMAVASDGALVRTAAGGIEVSTTGGASWDGVAAGAFDLVVASPDGATLYAVRYPAVVVRSLDGAESRWRAELGGGGDSTGDAGRGAVRADSNGGYRRGRGFVRVAAVLRRVPGFRRSAGR